MNPNSVDDTMEDELSKQRNKEEGRIKREAKAKMKKIAKQEAKKAKKAASKAARQAARKSIVYSTGSVIVSVFVVIFMIIGIVSFITTMPSLVQDKILSVVTGAYDGINKLFQGEDYYLEKLAGDLERTKQKEVLKYLDDMGVDPVGFGFAPFYTRYEDGTVDYDHTVEIEEIYEFGTLTGLWDSIEYNKQFKEKIKNEDLIFKYIVSNERTFLLDSKDTIFKNIGSFFSDDYTLTGMIKTEGIEGIDDSKIYTDRKSKSLIISSTNLTEFENQKFRYNLEGFTGRYGMPLEFLLALHIATMSSDLTEEMLECEDLNTEVLLAMDKDTYTMDYEVKYNGKDIPIKRGNERNSEDLKYIVDYTSIDENGETHLKIPEDKINEVKNKVNFASLYHLIKKISKPTIPQFEGEGSNNAIDITSEAIDALLGNQPIRVLNKFTGVAVNDYANFYARVSPEIWNNYLGVAAFSEEYKNYIEKGTPYQYKYESNILGVNNKESVLLKYYGINGTNTNTSPAYAVNGTTRLGVTYESKTSQYTVFASMKDYYTYSDAEKETIKTYVTSENGHSKLEVSNELDGTLDGTTYTLITYGLEYYKQYPNQLKEQDDYIGLIALLSQIDSYLYLCDLESVTDVKFLNIMYTAKEGDSEEIKAKAKGIEYGRQLINDRKLKALNLDANPTYGLNNSNLNVDETTGIKLLLTADFLSFCEKSLNTASDAEIRQYIESLIEKINKYNSAVSNKDGVAQNIIDDLFKQIDIGVESLKTSEIELIYESIRSQSDETEFVMPYIKHVIRHWYKDIVFDGAYDNTSKTLRLPQVLENGTEGLEVTAVLSGGTYKEQDDQPYVIKGDIVMQDGEEVKNTNYAGKEVTTFNGDKYNLGDGYRTTKKLFTQGRYYIFDGTPETAKSIWYAKELEDVGAGDFARISVKNGRINNFCKVSASEVNTVFGEAYKNGDWDVSTQVIAESRKNENAGPAVIEGDGYSIFLAALSKTASDSMPVNIYYIKIDKKLFYKSPVSNVFSYQDSIKSAERINKCLEDMGIVTIRKPVTFDSVIETNNDGNLETEQATGSEVVTLTAFSLLESMKSEDAEYIYRDLKEFLIELGYYTKAEFDYLSTKVLTWFMPSYIPENPEHWQQNDGEDVLKYGAILHAQKKDEETGEIVEKGFTENTEIVAPGNCRILEVSNDSYIKLEFDGISQPEIGMLDKYTMLINQIKVNENDVIKVLDSNGVTEIEMTIKEAIEGENIVKMGTKIAVSGVEDIQIILKNSKGAKLNNVEDYMSPELTPQSVNVTSELGYFYWLPYESNHAGTVVSHSQNEAAVGISQWTTKRGNKESYNNISSACEWLYNKNPNLCAELRTFINWSIDDVLADCAKGGQIKAAFETVAARDIKGFTELQKQLIIEERTKFIKEQCEWLLERNSVVIGSYFSLSNWKPYAGWENVISPQMSDTEIIRALFKEATTHSSTKGDLTPRWESQARLAIDILNGTFTDIEGWIENKEPAIYDNGKNTGYLD